jgi:adenylylsulfate kinase-like enzyme|tara:strand:+ start:82 stop:540 length:459 start_codon:yes stop_codon:yes gene_type:complete
MKKNIKGIWFFGYSGSGKTFASKIIAKKIKRSIVIDGDEVRKLISKDLQYNKKDRTIQTERILGFSIISIKQKLFPIISTSFLPKKIAKLAKENGIEIVEIERDKSFLFKKLKNKKNVVGVDIFYEKFVRKNIYNDTDFKKNINIFLEHLNF